MTSPARNTRTAYEAAPPPEPSDYEVLLAYVGKRIDDAMAELSRRHPRLSPAQKWGRPAGTREEPVLRAVELTNDKGTALKDKKGRPRVRWEPTRRTRRVTAYEAVCEVDWATTGREERRSFLRLNAAVDLFCKQKVGIGVVKLEYKRFAEAHTYWWLQGARVPAPGKEVDF
jgi:hypothetical protein